MKTETAFELKKFAINFSESITGCLSNRENQENKGNQRKIREMTCA